jgi:L-arabinokinase
LSSIVYYISGHGYGHAVRSSQVIEALKKAAPETDIHVRTTAPSWLFPPVGYSHLAIDVGMVQNDSLSMDIAATLRACRQLQQNAPAIIADELAYIAGNKIRLVIGDIPPLCFEIAARANLPSVAIANFTWDFIYCAYGDEYPDFVPVVVEMKRYYRQTTLALALPYSCNLGVFPRREEIPWIARVSALTRDEARRKFALPQSAVVVLLSFGGLGLDRLPWQELTNSSEFYFISSGKAECESGRLRIVSAAQRNYADLIRAADVIVTKPGYGIVADAIAHDVPVLYTDRGEFAEHERLVEALKACATAEFIPQADLLSGKLASYLARVLNKPRKETRPALNGAAIAAARILAVAEG